MNTLNIIGACMIGIPSLFIIIFVGGGGAYTKSDREMGFWEIFARGSKLLGFALALIAWVALAIFFIIK